MRGLRSFIAQSPAIGVAVGALIFSLGGAAAAAGIAGAQAGAHAASSHPVTASSISFHSLHLINGWKNGPVKGSGTAGYAISGGVVYLRGQVHGGTQYSAFAVLPRAARPAHSLYIAVVNFGPNDGELNILPNGSMSMISNDEVNATSLSSLSGVSFPLNS